MSDAALSKEAMLAGLIDIRLPETAAGGWVAELAVVVGLAAGLVAAVLGIMHLFGMNRRAPPPRSLADEIAASSRLPEAERRVRLLHLLKARSPERYAALVGDSALYRLGAGPSIDRIEAELDAHA